MRSVDRKDTRVVRALRENRNRRGLSVRDIAALVEDETGEVITVHQLWRIFRGQASRSMAVLLLTVLRLTENR